MKTEHPSINTLYFNHASESLATGFKTLVIGRDKCLSGRKRAILDARIYFVLKATPSSLRRGPLWYAFEDLRGNRSLLRLGTDLYTSSLFPPIQAIGCLFVFTMSTGNIYYKALTGPTFIVFVKGFIVNQLKGCLPFRHRTRSPF